MLKLVMKTVICGLLLTGAAFAAGEGEKNTQDLAAECCSGNTLNVSSAACSALVDAIKAETEAAGDSGKKTNSSHGG